MAIPVSSEDQFRARVGKAAKVTILIQYCHHLLVRDWFTCIPVSGGDCLIQCADV